MRFGTLVLPLLALAAGCTSGTEADSADCGGLDLTENPEGTVVTGEFRAEHEALHAELEDLQARTGELASLPADEQVASMQEIVGFFEEHLIPHAEWEEANLYNSVDARASEGPYPFTSSMRHDHTVVGRWIGELQTQSEAATPDATAFARQTDNLVGLVLAHFEAEEDVLLPVLDRYMSQEEYDAELGEGR